MLMRTQVNLLIPLKMKNLSARALPFTGTSAEDHKKLYRSRTVTSALHCCMLLKINFRTLHKVPCAIGVSNCAFYLFSKVQTARKQIRTNLNQLNLKFRFLFVMVLYVIKFALLIM